MKINFFKRIMKFSAIAMAAVVMFTSCDDGDDGGNDNPGGAVILDGVYIKGGGTALTDLTTIGKMLPTKNEVGQAERASLLELYVAVEEGDAGFQIVKVEGGVEKAYGPGDDFAVVDTANNGRITDEPRKPYDFSRGSLKEGTKFTVNKSALYHVVYDTEIGVVVVAEAAWGVIGAAVGSWSDMTPMVADFNKEKMSFKVQDTVYKNAEYKFRYSNGWKIVIDGEDVRVNTNLGGTLEALEAGGDNMTSGDYAIYDIELVWELGKVYTASMTYVKDGPPLAEYPENLYMIGGSLNTEDSDSNDTPDGWQWELTDMPMIPVHSNPHVFWRVVYLDPAGGGFKFSPEKAWGKDFGVDGDATEGVYAKGGNNAEVTEAGYYMVVVNLLDETVEVTSPSVNGIGDPFGDTDWAGNVEFTVDNEAKTITSPALSADGELRMYVKANTLTNKDGNAVDWWQAEFMVLSGVIEYRGIGGDQERVNGTAGQKIVLDFKAGTGTIE